MMNPRSKLFIVQAALLSLCMAAPTFVYAEADATSTARDPQVNFCASLEQATQKIAQNILEQESKYANKEKDRQSRFEDKVSARERTMQSTRLDTDVVHDRMFTKLVAHATTDEERAAIEKFKQGLNIAIATRRASVEAAVTRFNSESAKLIALRAHDIDNATTTLRNATTKAGIVARNNCKKGLAGTTVRARYTRDLKNARMQFQVDVASALKRNQGISPLIKSRDTDVKAAVDEFKDTLATLRLELETTLRAN